MSRPFSLKSYLFVFFRLTDRFNNDFVFNIDGIIVDATGETTQGSLTIISSTMQDTYIALPQIDIFNLSPFDGLRHRIPISTYGVFPHSSSFISAACTTSLPNIIMTLESQPISCDIIFTPSHICRQLSLLKEPKLLRIGHFSWGKIWFENFTPCKGIDISQLCWWYNAKVR